jgi:hypothetical protein
MIERQTCLGLSKANTYFAVFKTKPFHGRRPPAAVGALVR